MADSFNNWAPGGAGSYSGFDSADAGAGFRTWVPGAGSYSGLIAFLNVTQTSPGAPTAVAAVPGDAVAVVSWTAPGSTGNSPITSYQVTCSPAAAIPANTTQTLASGGTFVGLTNGTAYTFTVVAINGAGAGPASAASASVTIGTPAAPTAVTAVAGNASATVSWTDGATNGSAVTSYDIVSIPATTTQHFSSGGTFTGLSNGTAYTFKVTANNARGAGAQSAASNSVTPSNPFTFPTNSATFGLVTNNATDIQNWAFSSGLTSSLLNATDYLGNANKANTWLTSGTTTGEKYWWGNNLVGAPPANLGIKFGFMAKVGTSGVTFVGVDQTSSSAYVIFDLTGAGSVALTAGTGISGNIQLVANGWYFCEYVLAAPNTTGNTNFRVRWSDTAAHCVPGVGGTIPAATTMLSGPYAVYQ